jgi:hypothetical protein
MAIATLVQDERRAGAAAWWVASGASIFLLLTPAIWNGFPLIFSDTGGYLQRPLTGTLGLGRSALYGLFLLPGAPLAFWPNVALQAALIVWLIALTLRVHKFGDRPSGGASGGPWLLLGIVAVLTVTTSLPWFAAQLMPDILFPAGVLALYLLTFGGGELRTAERIGLAATIAFAIASHMAFMGVALGMIAALLVIGLLKDFPRPRLAFATGALAGGLLLAPVSNLAITGTFTFTPGGASFLFNRLVEDGTVQRYLDEACPDATLRICPYRSEIADYGYDDWLWNFGSPFGENKLGNWENYTDEERRIILATLIDMPLEHVGNAIWHSLDQVASFATEIATDRDRNFHVIWTFKDDFPQLYPQLMAARQQTGRLDVTPLNAIHIPVAALSMLGLAGALLYRRRLNLSPQMTALAATVLLALAVNAAVCGVFSHAADRYQSRLVLLAPLAVMIMLVQRRRV